MATHLTKSGRIHLRFIFDNLAPVEFPHVVADVEPEVDDAESALTGNTRVQQSSLGIIRFEKLHYLGGIYCAF